MNLINGKRGLVIKKFNNFFYVDIIDTREKLETSRFLCKSRKNIYHKKKFIFVGDEVIISQINTQEKTAVIENLLHRKNLLNRPCVANISDIYVIHSIKEPELNYAQLSKFLVNAEYFQVNVSLILTKSDLVPSLKHNFLYSKFQKWGYDPRILTLADNSDLNDFVDELKTNKCSILVGPSGVGKTTLLNKIIPNVNRATSSISKKIKRGKNTTRNIELFKLTKKSYIVDTPGFNIQNNFIEPINIAELFPEFTKQIENSKKKCKFRDCLHIEEPGCNLNKNFERYKFYKTLIAEAKSPYHQSQED